MPVVKMSDIKSGSENVKSIFRSSMSNRTIRFLETISLNNEELLEILDICQRIEKKTFTPAFYKRLILTQNNFNNDVFLAFLPNLADPDAFENLLKKCKDINDSSKKRFIDYVFENLPVWGFKKFFSQPLSKELGIDVTLKPFNIVYVSTLIAHIDIIFNVAVFTLSDEIIAEIDRIFATLTPSEIQTVYMSTNTLIKSDRLIQILLRSKNTPPNVFEYMVDKYKGSGSQDIKYKIVRSSKCPANIKLAYYQSTGDESVLPQTIQDVFLF